MTVNKHHILDFVVSMVTVYAVYLGTTALNGAIVYGVAMLGWWYVVFHNKAWGLVPSQIMFTMIGGWNIYYAIWK